MKEAVTTPTRYKGLVADHWTTRTAPTVTKAAAPAAAAVAATAIDATATLTTPRTSLVRPCHQLHGCVEASTAPLKARGQLCVTGNIVPLHNEVMVASITQQKANGHSRFEGAQGKSPPVR